MMCMSPAQDIYRLCQAWTGAGQEPGEMVIGAAIEAADKGDPRQSGMGQGSLIGQGDHVAPDL